MSGDEGVPSLTARLGGTLGMASAALVVIGVTGSSLQVLPPLGGFLLMALGLGVALIGLVLSVLGMIRSTGTARALAVRGFALCLVTLVAIAVPASRGSGVPRINDITTDTTDPPVFVAALEHGPNQGRDMDYPGEEFAAQQRQGYPDLAGLVVPLSPEASFDIVRDVLAAMPRTQVTGGDREAGRVEATQTSKLFHFADDVVVRIRPTGGDSSRIDVRSKSRDGRSDLGVNAERIRDILTRVQAAAGRG